MSSTERWPRVREVLEAALALPPGQRTAFLDKTCASEPEVRKEVDSLLARGDEARSFLEGSSPSEEAASLSGRKLAHYEILEAIGRGGMGEVYRARDSTLRRDVAIKVLPEAFAKDADRLGRFEREARVLASLNHPNIATIHGFEQSGPVRFLVMELVPGQTLADRLTRGSMPLDEALPLFKQIAEALEAAHEKGVVHRDLKPANIKLTPDNKVKVLDFGLAKVYLGDRASEDLSKSPTLTQEGTRAGVILGTAAYMSPEQARGETVDKRTDTWAFGCCLYEALTGKVAFRGHTVSDTIAKILEREPDWDALPKNTPPMVRSLLRRCLQKDPEHRQHDMADARIEIEESLTKVSGEFAVGAGVEPSTPTWQRRALWVAAAAAILVLLGGALALWISSRPSDSRSVARFSLDLPASLRMVPSSLAFSPDGSRIVYAASEKGGPQRLYVRSIDQLEATPIPGTEDGHAPFFSPDGDWVAFRAALKLKKVSLKGGAPVTLAAVSIGGSWADDDTIVFVPTPSTGLVQISASGGTPKVLLSPTTDPLVRFAEPYVLPGAEAVLFTLLEILSDGKGKQHVAVLSLETGQYRKLVEGTSPRYFKGYLVYGQRGSLFAVPFDPTRLELGGAPVPVLDGVRFQRDGVRFQRGGFIGFAVSKDGSLVYVPGEFHEGEPRRLVLVDRRGNVEPLTEQRRQYNTPRFSPDGQRIVMTIPEDEHDLWIFDVNKRQFSRLTFSSAADFCPVWSPDGTKIVFTSRRDRFRGRLFWKLADGSGPVEQLTSQESDRLEDQLAGSWSPRGDLVVYEQDLWEQDGQANPDIYLLPMDGGHEPRPFGHTPSVMEIGPKLSPDGRWIAYTSIESDPPQIYAQPFPTGGGKWQISTEGGRELDWGPDGREIFYWSGTKFMVVDIETEPAFFASEPRVLFDNEELATFGAITGFANFDVSPNGQTFVMVAREPAVTQFNVVLNWFEELKRLVPSH